MALLVIALWAASLERRRTEIWLFKTYLDLARGRGSDWPRSDG
jgi:hypothetical protein